MAWRLIILYLIPVLTTTVLRLKTDPLNDGTLSVLYMARWASTAVAALVGTGYYWSQLFSRFFKPAVFALSFIYWLFAFVYLGTFVLARILEQTQASRQNIAVLYFSDHGTNPINSFSRSDDDPEVNQVPMFLWFSDDYLQSPLKAAALPQNLPKHPATAEMSSVINALAGLTVETTTKEPL